MADKSRRAEMYNSDPARNAVAITPADADLADYPAALFIGTTGNVTVDLVDSGSNITFKNVPSGSILPISVKRVRAATTAADIIGIY